MSVEHELYPSILIDVGPEELLRNVLELTGDPKQTAKNDSQGHIQLQDQCVIHLSQEDLLNSQLEGQQLLTLLRGIENLESSPIESCNAPYTTEDRPIKTAEDQTVTKDELVDNIPVAEHHLIKVNTVTDYQLIEGKTDYQLIKENTGTDNQLIKDTTVTDYQLIKGNTVKNPQLIDINLATDYKLIKDNTVTDYQLVDNIVTGSCSRATNPPFTPLSTLASTSPSSTPSSNQPSSPTGSSGYGSSNEQEPEDPVESRKRKVIPRMIW